MTTPVVGGMRRRAVATACAAILATVTAAFVALPGAGAQVEATPAEAAGSWLADQLVDGERFEYTGFPGTDYGLTADTVVALAAAGVSDDFGADAAAFLGTSAATDGYITSDGFGVVGSGALAKLSIVAQTRGLDATNWGEDGVDLIQELLDLEDGNGRFVDDPDFGNDFKVFSHSFAIVALARQAGVDPSDASVDLLLTSQCTDGGFSGTLDPATCTSTVDATATALMALLATDRAADADEIDDALAYLVDLQGADGNLGNANATGLATYVLRVAGESAAADAGVEFLLGLQIGCDGPEADRGAVDVDGGAFDAASAPRATAQAIMGLTGDGYIGASATGATADQPRFDCTVDETPTTGEPTTPTSQPTTVAPTTATPPATPTRANPGFTG